MKEWKEFITQKTASCLICEKMDYTLKRYYFTICFNWIKDPEFRKLFNESKGFCHSHLVPLLEMGEKVFPAAKWPEFLNELITLQLKSYERLESELLWFTQKFKAENFDKPWGTSQDAHKRTVQKLSGK